MRTTEVMPQLRRISGDGRNLRNTKIFLELNRSLEKLKYILCSFDGVEEIFNSPKLIYFPFRQILTETKNIIHDEEKMNTKEDGEFYTNEGIGIFGPKMEGGQVWGKSEWCG